MAQSPEERRKAYGPSPALQEWRAGRLGQLDELADVSRRPDPHTASARDVPRPLEWALVLRLTTEFQGFARDLHDLAVDRFVASSVTAHHELVTAAFTHNRDLDRGNPHRRAIKNDFDRLGLDVVAGLGERDDQAEDHLRRLDKLVEVRNALAHSRSDKLARLRREGFESSRPAIESMWRPALNRLAATLDRTVWDYLKHTFLDDRPWSTPDG